MESEAPISVRALIGPAGRGKTRFALDLIDASDAEGWQAGFVTGKELARFRSQHNLAAWGWGASVLAVVDYAAGQAHLVHEWLKELAGHTAFTTSPGQTPPLRIVLLAGRVRSPWCGVRGSPSPA
jgi:hypothetical protein